MRPQEGRLLKRQDVDLDTGTFYIVDSKKNKDRIVAMSENLQNLCRKYDIIMQTKQPGREFFFQNPNGGPFTAAWIQKQFFKCWKIANITFTSNHKPRVYDWRHNFSTKVITKWMNEGKDVSTLLPYLSTYLGHSSLDYTAYYIHLIPESLHSSGLMDWICSREVPDYED